MDAIGAGALGDEERSIDEAATGATVEGVEGGGGGGGKDDGVDVGGALGGGAKMSPSSFQPAPCHDCPVPAGVGAAGGAGGGETCWLAASGTHAGA